MRSDLTSSVELVYQTTRYAILTGDYLPGSQLRLHELATRNGVSMIPVREALRLLEAEGFVETVPNHGARVTPLSMEDMLDLYRTRLVLELEALRQAAPNITPQILAKARRLNHRIVRQMEQRGYASYEDHRAFHFLLYEQSHSKWLMRLLGIIWDHTERYSRMVGPRVTPVTAGEEHERILERLETGDASGATLALRDHLEHSMKVFTEFDRTVTDGTPLPALSTVQEERHLMPSQENEG